MRLVRIVALVFLYFYVQAAEWKLIKEIHICKRNDPEIGTCYCDNFQNMIPLFKDGIPQMNVIPIDPLPVDNIHFRFASGQSIQLNGILNNVSITGVSAARSAVCQAFMTTNGIQTYHELLMPLILLNGTFAVKGSLFMHPFDTTGGFHAQLFDNRMITIWNTTRYTKNNVEYLEYASTIKDILVNKMNARFDNLFSNNPTLTEAFNKIINDEIDVLYAELKPEFLTVVNRIGLKVVNGFMSVFPFDALFPVD